MFSVTELERFADCSSAWLFERVISPRTIDAQADAMLRGSVAHSALHKFFTRIPKELVPKDAKVEMDAKVAAGYYTDSVRPGATELAEPKGRAFGE